MDARGNDLIPSRCIHVKEVAKLRSPKMASASKPKTDRRNGAVSQRVLDYLAKNPNIVISQTAIQRDLNLPDYSVSNAIGYLIAKGLPIKRQMRGTALYSTAPKAEQSNGTRPVPPVMVNPPTKLYEYLGVSNGRIIVRDEEEELYVLSPLFGE